MLQDARFTALQVLVNIEKDKKKADQALEQAFRKHKLPARDRRLVTELVLGVLRYRNRLDWVLDQYCKKPIAGLSPTLRNILRMGSYQLLFLDRIPARAVVDEAVKLTRRKGAKGASGFVNAVLRSIDRKQALESCPDPLTAPIQHLAIRFAHPVWMVSRWLERYGSERTIAICAYNNEVPPVTLRANTLLTTRDRLRELIKNREIDIEPCSISPVGLKTRGGMVIESEAYEKGWFYIQDEAAQLVAYAVSPKPGEIVLDACAAPGGKTTNLAQFMENKGRIIALDNHSLRLRLVRKNCERLGVRIATCMLGDARDSRTLTGLQFDRILVDAPCSGLGVLRRNPDGKWYKTPDLIPRYAKLQTELLEAVSRRLKKDGILVYSTCTTEPEENEAVVNQFLQTHSEYYIENLRDILPPSASSMITADGFLFTLFNKESMDGFFVARLKKEV